MTDQPEVAPNEEYPPGSPNRWDDWDKMLEAFDLTAQKIKVALADSAAHPKDALPGLLGQARTQMEAVEREFRHIVRYARDAESGNRALSRDLEDANVTIRELLLSAKSVKAAEAESSALRDLAAAREERDRAEATCESLNDALTESDRELTATEAQRDGARDANQALIEVNRGLEGVIADLEDDHSADHEMVELMDERDRYKGLIKSAIHDLSHGVPADLVVAALTLSSKAGE
jgi:chromosome segregation ATPase